MVLIAANITGVLEAASTLRPAAVGGGIGAGGAGRVAQFWRQAPLGEPGAEAAMSGFSGAMDARVAELDHLVDRAAAVLAVYAVNFDRAGG